MAQTCLKCGHKRQPSDIAPEYECPKCGAVYAKVLAADKGRRGNQGSQSHVSQHELFVEHEILVDTQSEVTTHHASDLVRELSLLIRSRYGLIWFDTVEEERIESILKHVADALGLPFFIWSISQGLHREDLGSSIYGTTDPKVALDSIEFVENPAVYHFQGLGPFLEDPVLSGKLVGIARKMSQNEGALILTGTDVAIPEAAKVHTAMLTPPPPKREDYAQLLKHIYRDVCSRMKVTVEMSRTDMNRLINNLQGLTLLEAEKILTKAFIEDGRLSVEDIQLVIDAKRGIIEREGLLEYFPVEQSMADIADLSRLKAWLGKRKHIICHPKKAAEFGLQFPKGILLLGVPGSGKSLCAKAVAMEWGLPLLKMDPSNLYNKYIGESEKNFKRAMETAEKMAPVVFWIDEIEKAFASGGSEDSGVSQRILGIFLSWMQDRKGGVFAVATANDVGRLPPELLRKGRFDEIFFMDLPDHETRMAIFAIHLRRRGHNPPLFDLARIADVTDGFSGAEIEQVVVSALYSAFSDGAQANTDLLIEEAGKTQPLSRTRAEDIQALRNWARERTVSAQ